jgi:hypothetical protein
MARGFSGRFSAVEFAIEEVGCCPIGGEPIFVQKEVVNFVGEDELFEFDASSTESRDEVHGLREIDVSVIVAVNEKNR